MNKKYHLLSIILIIVLHWQCFSQSVIEGWGDHLPYNTAKKVAMAGQRVYVATQYSLFYYDKDDFTLERLSKINGLSDFEVSDIHYAASLNTLIIAYQNANIDLIKEGRIVNVSDIKVESSIQTKKINNIYVWGNLAYLSCNFGVVVLDIDKEEIHDTYFIGGNGTQIFVSDFTYYEPENRFYAATEQGLYYADKDAQNLADYQNWHRDLSIPSSDGEFNNVEVNNEFIYANLIVAEYPFVHDTIYVKDSTWKIMPIMAEIGDYNHKSFIESHSGWLFVGKHFADLSAYSSLTERSLVVTELNPEDEFVESYVKPNDVYKDEDGVLWIADVRNGLIKYIDEDEAQMILPNGPSSSLSFDLEVQGSQVYVSPGGFTTTWVPMSKWAEVYSYDGNSWKNYTRGTIPELEEYRDIVSIAIDPSDSKHIFAGTMGSGLLEFLNGELINRYTTENSTLKGVNDGENDIRVPAVKFDKDGNLWATNNLVTNILSVRIPDGTVNGKWMSFNLQGVANNAEITKLMIDQNGYKWIVIRARGNGVIVFNDNETVENITDDQVKRLSTNAGNGNIQSEFIYSIASDLDNEIWLGAAVGEDGVRVIYNPQGIFNNSNFDADDILVLQGGHYGYLLKTETVKCITVNGANQKWFGTANSGAYLMSEDGTEEIYHFTKDNSPLYDNEVLDIAIDENGNVFFATAKGLISFKDRAVPPKDDFSHVNVYPNPVRENYNGLVAIRGLKRNSDIRITDISGNLVYATKSDGGQATWNVKNFDGQRVQSGVYLIFITDETGTETTTSKIAVIH